MRRQFSIFNLAIVFGAYLLIGLFSLAYAQEATQPGKSIRDTLRERVEQRLTQLARKPRAFVGKLVQISNSVLILETKQGTKQVKITPDPVIIQIGPTSRKTIKASDLVLGNFVVAMGYLENKDTLAASRILTTTENPLRASRPVYGIVQEIRDGTFVVKHPKKDEVWTVKTSSKTRVTAKVEGKIEKVNMSVIGVGDRIIAVGGPVKGEANTITARLIHVIPGKAKGLLKSPKPTPASPAGRPKASPSPTP